MADHKVSAADIVRQLPPNPPVVALVRHNNRVEFPYTTVHTIGDFFQLSSGDAFPRYRADRTKMQFPLLAETLLREDAFNTFDCDFLKLPANLVLPPHRRALPGALMRAYLQHWLPRSQMEAIGLVVDPSVRDSTDEFAIVLPFLESAESVKSAARFRGIPLRAIAERDLCDWFGVPELSDRVTITDGVLKNITHVYSQIGFWMHYRIRINFEFEHERPLAMPLFKAVEEISRCIRNGDTGAGCRATAKNAIHYMHRIGGLGYVSLYHLCHAIVNDKVTIDVPVEPAR